MKTHDMDRREFLKNVAYGAAALSAAGLGPLRARAQSAALGGAGSPTGRRLLILNLAGGFDPVYVLQPDLGALADRRPGLFQDPNQLLPFSGQLGLTPSFPFLGETFRAGEAIVIQRVGVVGATREHFPSEQLNALGVADRRQAQQGRALQGGGWVQRVADANPDRFTRATDVVDLSNGNPTVRGGRFSAATVNASLRTFARRSLPEVDTLGRAGVNELDAISFQTPLALEGARGSLAAAELSTTLAQAVERENAERERLSSVLQPYPDTGLGAAIRAVETTFGQLGTQVAYVRTGGFDTHGDQAPAIAQLFGGLDATLTAFRNNLIARDLWDGTIIMTTTDFGRTIAMNNSRGTDHGRGASTYLIGGAVPGGRILGEEYTAADFSDRFLPMQINAQSILREVVGALGYEPEAAFGSSAPQENLRIFG